MSRVRTISIRPGESDYVTALDAEEWKSEASRVLKGLSKDMQLFDVESHRCFGVTIRTDEESYYHVILMQLTVTARAAVAASSAELDHMWKEYIAMYASISWFCSPSYY